MPGESEESGGSLPRLLGRIAYGSAEKVSGATSEAGSLITGVYDTIVPEIIPDMEKVDNMVSVATVSAYSLIAFGVTGTIFFSLKTVRELGQWRTWWKFTRNMTSKNNNKLATTSSSSKKSFVVNTQQTGKS